MRRRDWFEKLTYLKVAALERPDPVAQRHFHLELTGLEGVLEGQAGSTLGMTTASR